MKHKVVISALFVDGVRYSRGDIVDVANPEIYGVKLEPVSEPKPEPELVEVKPKRRGRPKKNEA